MNNKRRCSICKNYITLDIFDDEKTSWCEIKNAYIKMPSEHVCGHFEYKWVRRLITRLFSVRGMMGR